MSYNEMRLPEDLKIYYKNLFPVNPLVSWMRYGKVCSEYFNRREFAFILHDEIHLRYRSFNDENSFFNALLSTCPEKLDIGAVFNHEPMHYRRFTDFQAVERELVFDIDLSDYDPVRTCCKNATVCAKCWKFMVLAARILDFQLLDQFGFRSRLWVFSGRRGIHCWVADKTARVCNSYARSSICKRLNYFKPNGDCEVTERRGKITRCTPHIRNSFKEALKDDIFEEMVYEQGWLEGEQWIDDYRWMSDGLKYTFRNMIKIYKTPQQRWHMLKAMFDEDYKMSLPDDDDLKHREPEQNRDRYFFIHFVLKRCYPRLDVNVTNSTNHLLKSPFSIHPKTGNVAVPLDVDFIHLFDVEDPPRIDEVVEDFKRMEPDLTARKLVPYEYGLLAPYFGNFEKFICSIFD